MANPTIGFIDCAFGGGKSEVRKDKKGKYYYYNEFMGMIKPNLIAGQAYMKKHTKFIGDNGSPLPPIKPENSVNESKSEIKPVTEQSEQKNKSWLENFLSD
jgi:hypothetical protein